MIVVWCVVFTFSSVVSIISLSLERVFPVSLFFISCCRLCLSARCVRGRFLGLLFNWTELGDRLESSLEDCALGQQLLPTLAAPRPRGNWLSFFRNCCSSLQKGRYGGLGACHMVSRVGAMIFSEPWLHPHSCCPLSRAPVGPCWAGLCSCQAPPHVCSRPQPLPCVSSQPQPVYFLEMCGVFSLTDSLWLSSLLQSHGPFLPSFCLLHLKYLQTPYDLMSAIAAHPRGVGKCYRNTSLRLRLGEKPLIFSCCSLLILSNSLLPPDTFGVSPHVSSLLIPIGYHNI